jgi:hypothetical protein
LYAGDASSAAADRFSAAESAFAAYSRDFGSARSRGDPGCADFGYEYQRQTVLIRLRRGFTSVWFLSDLLLIMLLI